MFIMIDIESYLNVKDLAKEKYCKFSELFCPALNEKISFNSIGFNHIIYKKGGTERDRLSQIMRFKLLDRAYDLISLTTTYQEYEKSKAEFVIKKNKSKIKATKEIEYWGLIAILKHRKIKVILRKVGNGSIHFWSIIPGWTTNKMRDDKLIKNMKGDPELD